MAKKIIRPIKGINIDSGLNRRDDNSVYMAKNLRINSNDEVSSGGYVNVKGSNDILNIGSSGDILKIYKIHDNIVVFIYNDSTHQTIALIKESELPKNGEAKIDLDISNYYWQGTVGEYHKIITGNFGLSASKDIEIKAYYESDDIQKIYWTTEGEPLRSLNIIYSESNDPHIFTPQDLEASPIADLDIPFINNTISGNLLTGKIYYAYTLVNSIGAETNLSELSFPYHITKSSENELNDFDYKGYGFDVNSGKGINLTIDNIPNSFNRLKLYSIHYIDDVSIPLIKLIYDGYASETLTINDYGTALLELSTEEFIGKNNLFSTDGQLEIKNNRLFLANYTEEFFDIDEVAPGGYWDSRSYRFPISSTTSKIYEEDLSTYLTINSTYNVSETHDAINKSNDIESVSATVGLNNYYQLNNTTLGSSGLNISIEQKTTTFSSGFIEPDDGAEGIKWYATRDSYGYDSYASPRNDSVRKTFKLEEVYRLSIQFKNSKGQLSYPKWIGDHKFVYPRSSHTPIDNSGDKIKMNRYYLDFTVSNIPTDPLTEDAYEYRILHVPITESDQSVFWGLFNHLYKVTGTDNYRANILETQDVIDYGACSESRVPTSISYKYAEFVNPDYCFGNKRTYVKAKKFMEVAYRDIGPVAGGCHSYYQSNIFKVYDFINQISVLIDIDNQYDIAYNSEIDSDVSLSSGDTFLRNGETVIKLISPRQGGNSCDQEKIYGNSNKGRCQILEVNSSVLGDESAVFGCCYVDNFQSRYNGLGYNARKSNGYIPLSSFTNSSTNEVWGDSTAGLFEYLRQISDNQSSYIKNNQERHVGGDGIQYLDTTPLQLPGGNEILIFPTYTNINLKLRSDDYMTKVYTKTGAYMLHEYAGVYENLSLAWPDKNKRALFSDEDEIFTQETDLYLFNKTYSRDQDLFKYYEKPILNSIITDFKNRIIASNHKILGESSDSFLKIAPGQYIDVDGQYGEIKHLQVFNDKLYFFQDDAIGIVAVNEKATTNVADGSELILGTVGLLSRYDYITTSNGINNVNHVAISNKSMYIIDEIRKQILKIDSNGIEKISITKHVNSLINAINLSDARIVYNRKYNEILFYYEDPDSSSTHIALVYNEQLLQFTSILSNYKKVLNSVHVDRIDLYDELILDDNDGLSILNDGDYNKFGNSYVPSEITFLIAANQENNVLFNIIEFISEQKDSFGNKITDFIDTIRIYNTECDTGELDFSTNSKYKFGKYRTDKLRNYANSKPKERILSDHIYVTIRTESNYIYNPATHQTDSLNQKIYFRDLITTFSEYNYFGY